MPENQRRGLRNSGLRRYTRSVRRLSACESRALALPDLNIEGRAVHWTKGKSILETKHGGALTERMSLNDLMWWQDLAP